MIAVEKTEANIHVASYLPLSAKCVIWIQFAFLLSSCFQPRMVPYLVLDGFKDLQI